MASGIKHFKKFSIVQGNVKVDMDLSKLGKRFQDAQFALDSAIMTSMVPFMPMNEGNFVHLTEIISESLAGTGVVCAAAPPFGRYLYEGKVMVDSKTGKGPRKIPDGPGGGYVLRFRKRAKLVETKRPLNYSVHAHPNVTDHWFDAAKEQDLKKWVKTVKDKVGGR